METRADVLCRNHEVFAYWRRLGLEYMFLGLEAIDEEGLKAHRKRSSTGVNNKALEIARKIGLCVAINLIAEPDWDERRFEIVREWALSVPEVVHLTVATPYPGTETWFNEARRLTTLDYRLFDIQHAVLPTRMPLPRFYEELVKTQNVNRKHLGLQGLKDASAIALKLLIRGQTNFIRMLFKFSQVYNVDRQYQDHLREVRYAMCPPRAYSASKPQPNELYIHQPKINRTPADRISVQDDMNTSGAEVAEVASGHARASRASAK